MKNLLLSFALFAGALFLSSCEQCSQPQESHDHSNMEVVPEQHDTTMDGATQEADSVDTVTDTNAVTQ